MQGADGILVAGGTGVVGRRVARDLARDYPDQVIVAARQADIANQLASEIGHGTRSCRIDVRDRDCVESALADVDTVISCVAQSDTPHLLLGAIAHGCGYTDIAPMAFKRTPYPTSLAEEAVRTGARIVLGAGLVPGVSNVLARMGADRVGEVEAVETTCLLSVGDEYGTDSKQYIAQEIATRFNVRIDGTNWMSRPFTLAKTVEFEAPLGKVRAYLFPFSDQIHYPTTLGARTSISRLALLPGWVSRVLPFLVPLVGDAHTTRDSPPSQQLNRLMGWLKRKYDGLDWWGVHVEVSGAGGLWRGVVQGHRQAQGAATSAAAVVRALAERKVDRPGVWTAEQIIPVEYFLQQLAARGLAPSVSFSV